MFEIYTLKIPWDMENNVVNLFFRKGHFIAKRAKLVDFITKIK